MLVVVEYGDVQHCFQPFLDLKATGRTDIFQIDAAESGSQISNRFNDLFGILCIQADRNRVYSAKFFEKNRLSFHYGHGGIRAYIAKAEDGASVGNNGYSI